MRRAHVRQRPKIQRYNKHKPNPTWNNNTTLRPRAWRSSPHHKIRPCKTGADQYIYNVCNIHLYKTRVMPTHSQSAGACNWLYMAVQCVNNQPANQLCIPTNYAPFIKIYQQQAHISHCLYVPTLDNFLF